MGYSMSDLLTLIVSEGSSDLHVRVGIPPCLRVHGVLERVQGPPLKPEDTEELMRSISSEDHIQQVRENGGADFGFAFGDAARFINQANRRGAVAPRDDVGDHSAQLARSDDRHLAH